VSSQLLGKFASESGEATDRCTVTQPQPRKVSLRPLCLQRCNTEATEALCPPCCAFFLAQRTRRTSRKGMGHHTFNVLPCRLVPEAVNRIHPGRETAVRPTKTNRRREALIFRPAAVVKSIGRSLASLVRVFHAPVLLSAFFPGLLPLLAQHGLA
jgi:hypothetical protein